MDTLFTLIFCISCSTNQMSDNIVFKWIDAEIDKKYFEKVAMVIESNFGVDTNTIRLQLDLAAPESMLYINHLPTYLTNDLGDSIFSLKELNYKLPSEYRIKVGNNISRRDFLIMNYETDENLEESIKYFSDVSSIGTLGRDIIKESILIDYPKGMINIDLPKQKLNKLKDQAVLKLDIHIEDNYLIYLPVSVKDKIYWVMMDTGSSMFNLLLNQTGFLAFNPKENFDSFNISAWGESTNVKLVSDSITFNLGNKLFSMDKFFYRSDQNFDCLRLSKPNEIAIGVIGNQLFLENKIIIDYKNSDFYILE